MAWLGKNGILAIALDVLIIVLMTVLMVIFILNLIAWTALILQVNQLFWITLAFLIAFIVLAVALGLFGSWQGCIGLGGWLLILLAIIVAIGLTIPTWVYVADYWAEGHETLQ